jgi:hypothetical protein
MHVVMHRVNLASQYSPPESEGHSMLCHTVIIHDTLPTEEAIKPDADRRYWSTLAVFVYFLFVDNVFFRAAIRTP